jgi:hypothetical protein
VSPEVFAKPSGFFFFLPRQTGRRIAPVPNQRFFAATVEVESCGTVCCWEL